jgi:hypothetical protein
MLNLWLREHLVYVCHQQNLVAKFRSQKAMKLLRFAGLVFIFITTFQFVNIRYYGGDIFSLSSQDKFPVSIDVSTEPVSTLSGPERLNSSSSRSVEVDEEESTGLKEDHVIGFDKNDTVQGHDSFVEDVKDKETLDLLPGTKSSSNESYEKIVEDADIAFENIRKMEWKMNTKKYLKISI